MNMIPSMPVHRPTGQAEEGTHDIVPYRTQTRQPASHAALALPPKYALESEDAIMSFEHDVPNFDHDDPLGACGALGILVLVLIVVVAVFILWRFL